MSTDSKQDSFDLMLNEKFLIHDIEFTWTSFIVETVVNPDHTFAGQNVDLEFSISDGPDRSTWTLMLPASYHDYIRKNPDACSYRTSKVLFRLVDLNIESMSNPTIKIICAKH